MNTKLSITSMIYIALMAVIITICSWISIPGPVPFTLQTFAVFTALLLLGTRDGLISIVVYLLLGAVGVPVFSGFSGGIGHLLGPTGGYLIGFIVMGFVFGNAWAGLGIGLFIALVLGTSMDFKEKKYRESIIGKDK